MAIPARPMAATAAAAEVGGGMGGGMEETEERIVFGDEKIGEGRNGGRADDENGKGDVKLRLRLFGETRGEPENANLIVIITFYIQFH